MYQIRENSPREIFQKLNGAGLASCMKTWSISTTSTGVTMKTLRTVIPFAILPFFLGCEPDSPASVETPAVQPLAGGRSGPQQIAADPEFTRLKLADFDQFQADSTTWTEDSGDLICSGVPKGYIYSKKKYRNFTLRADYQFTLTQEQMENPEKANTGFMIAIQEPQKVWPVSLEVQGRFDMMGSINGNGGIPRVPIKDDPDVRERVRMPLNQWNSIDITVRDGVITSKLNGEVVCVSEPTDLLEGSIGLQAEGYVVRFRDLRIREDEPDNVPN